MAGNHLATAGRSGKLLDMLADYVRFVVVTHDNPDPDAIATGWGVCVLIEECLGRPVEFVAGGAITRAENRQLVELLSPPIELVEDLSCDRATAVILVDCGLGTNNHLVTRQGIQPVAVIDHHGGHPPGGKLIAWCASWTTRRPSAS